MLDLDGVVYVGDTAVPGAAGAILDARAAGMAVAFITNNASRPPERVAAHLTELGIPAAGPDVVTSAQAAARLVVDRFGEGARAVCLGGDGLRAALVALGVRPVGAQEEADVLVTGYGPEVRWRDIMTAAVRIGDGLPWVASNTDHTIPTPAGIAPGHGVLVQTLSTFAGVRPVVAGKPERPLLDETVRRMGGRRPLMVGDRLDTDIEGARRVGVPSLLVLTGVTGRAELLAAAPEARPSFLAAGLGGLATVHRAPRADAGGWRCGAWVATVDRGRLLVQTAPSRQLLAGDDGDPLDAWRACAAAAWEHQDHTGEVPDIGDLTLPDDGRGGR
ncbi:HAD-IIA family hydrolase [Nocardioides sp. BGMRC 2183]|nr:HAD-IIA family hydrolase [Nocardioides sp. BGMRC 2183]